MKGLWKKKIWRRAGALCLALLLLTGACSCSHFGAAYGKISKEQEAGEGRSLSLSIHLDEISYVKAGEVIFVAYSFVNVG